MTLQSIFDYFFLNPIHALVKLLASMHSPSGKIMIDCFYDAVMVLSDSERAQIAEIPYEEYQYRHELGVKQAYCMMLEQLRK